MNFKITSLIFFSLIIVLSFIFLLNYYPPIFSNLFEINSDINHLNYFTLRPYLLLTQIYISLTLFFYFQRIKYTDLLVYIYIFFSLLILTMGNVNHPHGDEAHRLINAHSLGYDFDFDLTNNYKEELFKYMVPDRHTVLINGKEFPVHWPSVAIYLFIPSFISSILNFDPLYI